MDRHFGWKLPPLVLRVRRQEKALLDANSGMLKLAHFLVFSFIINEQSHSLTCPPQRETQSKQQHMTSIAYYKRKQQNQQDWSGGSECIHIQTHEMTYTANSAALPLCLSSLWSREQGQGRHIHAGMSGNSKRTRCSKSDEKAGRGTEQVVEQHTKKFQKVRERVTEGEERKEEMGGGRH